MKAGIICVRRCSFPHWAGSVIRHGKRLMRGVLPVKLRLHAEMPKRHIACFKSAGMPEAEQLRQDECFFELGKNAYAAGDYNRAEICFDSITDKSGFAARTDEVRIAAAESFLGAGEMPQAMRCFSLCSDESKSNICRIYITQGENLLQNFEIESAYKCFNGAKTIVRTMRLPTCCKR